MNILLVGGDAQAQAENLNVLQLAFGDEAELKSTASFDAARRELQSGQYQIVLDLGLFKETRWRLLRLARQLDPLVQVIMIFESGDEDLITDALRQGVSEVLVQSRTYPALLPLIVERAYERYLLLAQRRSMPRQAFDLKALDEITQAVTQAMDLGKAMDQARTALREVDNLLETSREELVKRRAMLREAGSEVQRRERGLKALSELAEAVGRSPELDFILTNALDQALAMMAAEAGAVLVVEGESKPLRLAAQKRLSDSFVAALSGRRLDVGTFMTFLLSGKVLLVQDVAHSDAPPELLALLSQEGFISTIGVPLQAGGRLLGGLLVATRHAGRLTTRDARWLGVMGQQVGVAIENARLRTEIWEAAETWFRQPTVPSPEIAEEAQAEMERLAQALDETKHQLRRRENALAAITNVIGAASYRPDVQDILRETLHYILDEFEGGGIWILDEPAGSLALAVQEGLPESLARPWSRAEWEQDDLLARLMSGEFVHLDDPSLQPGDGLMGHLKAVGARVVIGVPLQIQEQSVGAMVIMARQSGRLQAGDAELLAAVGQQLGQAVERQKLHDDIRRLALELVALRERGEEESPALAVAQAGQTEAAGEARKGQPAVVGEEARQRSKELIDLLALTQLFFPKLDTDKLMETATQEIARMTHMDACWVMVLEGLGESEREELVMRAHHGLSEGFARHVSRLTTDKGLYGQVVTSDQPIFLSDLNQAAEEVPIAWELESLRAFAGFPLQVEGRRLGLLAVARTDVHRFSPSERRWLTAIAQQLSIALHNAQRFAQIQQTAIQQEKGNRVLREINNLLMERLAEVEKRLETSKAAQPPSE